MDALKTAPQPVREELSASCKLVWLCVDGAGELTQTDIIERTRLPKRTVRKALRQLEDAGVIASRPSLSDARTKIYEPA